MVKQKNQLNLDPFYQLGRMKSQLQFVESHIKTPPLSWDAPRVADDQKLTKLMIAASNALELALRRAADLKYEQECKELNIEG